MSTRRDDVSPAIFGVARVRPRVADQVPAINVLQFGDVYSAWRIAELQSGEALHTWFQAPAGDRRTAYIGYRAALDREESAARNLERLWRHTLRDVAVSGGQ